MAPRLLVTIVAQIDRAIRDYGLSLTRTNYLRIAKTYNVSIQTIYRHKSRIEVNRPVRRPWGGLGG